MKEMLKEPRQYTCEGCGRTFWTIDPTRTKCRRCETGRAPTVETPTAPQAKRPADDERCPHAAPPVLKCWRCTAAMAATPEQLRSVKTLLNEDPKERKRSRRTAQADHDAERLGRLPGDLLRRVGAGELTIEEAEREAEGR